MIRSNVTIFLLVPFLVPCIFAVAQEQEFYYSSYFDNESRWVKHHSIKEKRTFEVTVDASGDSTLILSDLTRYNADGNIYYQQDFFSSDFTSYDEMTLKYDGNRIVEAISVMKDPYDEIKTVYEYKGPKLTRFCDYSRQSPERPYELDSCTTLVYKKGILSMVVSNKKPVVHYQMKDDTIFQYHDGQKPVSKYFNGRKVIQYNKDKHVLYEYNADRELVKITNIDVHGDTLMTTDFVWRDHLLVSSHTKDFKGDNNRFMICRYEK